MTRFANSQSPRGGTGGHAVDRRPNVIHTFSTGEISPRMLGRIDLSKYYGACLTLENALLLKQGPVTKRPGTKFVAEAGGTSVKLVPFRYSVTQNYVLEFGNQRIRFYRDDIQLEETPGTPTEIETEYGGSQLEGLKFNQDADVLTITHPLHQPRQLRRTAGDDTDPDTWELVAIDVDDGPYLDQNIEPIRMFIDAGGTHGDSNGTVTIKTLGGDVFSPTDAPTANNAGRLIRMLHDKWGVARVSSYISATEVQAKVIHPFSRLKPFEERFGHFTGTRGTPQIDGDLSDDGRWERRWGLYATGVPFRTTRSLEQGVQDVAGYVFTESTLPYDNVVLRARFVRKEANSMIRIAINMKDKDNYYAAEFTSATTAKFFKVVDGTETEIHEETGLTGSYRIAIGRNGPNVLCYNGFTVVHSEAAEESLDSGEHGIVFTVGGGTANGGDLTDGSRIDDLQGTPAVSLQTTTWRLGAWHRDQDWPQCSVYHKERQWFGGTLSFPNGIDGSMTAQFTDFSPDNRETGEVLETNALRFLVRDNQVNAIRWLISHGQGLMILTDGGPFSLTTDGDPSKAISPLDYSFNRRGTTGVCTTAAPIVAGSSILFLETNCRTLYEMGYAFSEDAFQTVDMMILADHLTAQYPIDGLAYQQEPDNVLWGRRSDGQMLGMTYERNEQVVGWHRHVLGGAFDGGQAVVESSCVIRENNRDQLWLAVKRTINGQTKRYIEVMDARAEDGDEIGDRLYVDSAVTYSGSATTSVTGLNHLEGQSIKVVADGTVHTLTVASGAVTLPTAASEIQAGLNYTMKVKPVPLTFDPQNLDPVGSSKLPNNVSIMLHESSGGKVRVNGGTFESIPTGSGLYTGVHTVQVAGHPDKQPTIEVWQDEPLPMTILAISAYLDSGE